jgi:hypothetical protein
MMLMADITDPDRHSDPVTVLATHLEDVTRAGIGRGNYKRRIRATQQRAPRLGAAFWQREVVSEEGTNSDQADDADGLSLRSDAGPG